MDNQTNNRQPAEESALELSDILKIRRDKLDTLKAEGRNPFEITRYDRTAYAADIAGHFEAMEGKTVSLAGRLLSKRGMGKASFCDLQDASGRIQIYVKIDEVGEEAYAAFQKLDIGDIIGVKGEVFRTRRGEISVKVSEVMLLPNRSCRYRKNSTDCGTPSCVTANGMSISSSIRRCATPSASVR